MTSFVCKLFSFIFFKYPPQCQTFFLICCGALTIAVLWCRSVYGIYFGQSCKQIRSELIWLNLYFGKYLWEVNFFHGQCRYFSTQVHDAQFIFVCCPNMNNLHRILLWCWHCFEFCLGHFSMNSRSALVLQIMDHSLWLVLIIVIGETDIHLLRRSERAVRRNNNRHPNWVTAQ